MPMKGANLGASSDSMASEKLATLAGARPSRLDGMQTRRRNRGRRRKRKRCDVAKLMEETILGPAIAGHGGIRSLLMVAAMMVMAMVVSCFAAALEEAGAGGARDLGGSISA